jgi:uncharacterized membrane protein YphA (DoxX/SURF4 family)
VQRLFFMFPHGLPGLALLLLRAAVAIALLTESFNHPHWVSGTLQAMAILLSVVILAGCWTPIVAAVALVLHGLVWLATGVDSAAMAIVFCLDAIALALLGPGAYSLDSYRFGRRLVVPPP